MGYENLNEIFFDVFEIKSKNLDLVKEKKGDFNGNPIIEVDLRIKNEIFKNVRFVLTKENGIRINPNLLDYTKVVVYEKENKIIHTASIIEKKVGTPVVITEKRSLKSKPILIEKNLIEKTKEEFFESIKGEVLEELKREVKAGIIADLIKENLQTNFDSVIHDNGNKNKLQRILENFNNSFRKEFIDLAEKVSRREAMRYSESGGGTNAAQYANGGTMDGNLNVTGNIHSSSMMVDRIDVDTLKVNTLSTNNEFVIHNLSVTEGITAYNIDVETLKVKTLSADNEFVIHNLSVTEGITANNVLLYDTLSSKNSIYSNYGDFYDLTVNHNLSTKNNAYVYGTLSSYNSKSDYSTINHNLSVLKNITTNYETVNNDLSVLGKLYANQAAVTNNLTVGGRISSYNGSYVLGDVIVTGNLTVSNSIYGDLVSGNTITNSSGDTLLTKAVKTFTGLNFTNGNHTVYHNLSSFQLLLTLYYVDPNGAHEVVHASMINDTLSTTQISFASQPDPTDIFKLIIMA